MKVVRPWFKLYNKDFLSSTADMSVTEVGAYARLLFYAWGAEPEATIPDNDDQIRRIAGADKDEWAQIRDAVLAKFEADERFPGRLLNKRLRMEWEGADEHAETQRERGKKGAAARWKKKHGDAPSIDQAGVKEMDDE